MAVLRLFLLVVLGFGLVTCDYEICNMLKMGGVGDGLTDNTMLLRKLFDNCDKVIIPYGETYLTSPLNITRNHFTLVLEGTLLFNNMSNLNDWPVMPHLPSYPCDRDICSCCRYQPPLLVYQAKNVTIQGQGELNGQGEEWWDAFRSKTLAYGRPRLFQTMYSHKVKITDIKMTNSPFWTCHLYSSSNLFIEGVSVFAPKTAPNTDGFDPDSSSFVHIKNCVVNNGDDCVAIKSGMDEAGLAYNKPSKHIYISGLKCAGGHGLSLGSEMSGGIEDVIIADSQTSNQLRIKTTPSRGGYVRDVTFQNIIVVGSWLKDTGLILIQTNYSSDAPPSRIPTVIDNIRYEGITGRGGCPGKFLCTREIPCKNLVLVDVDFDSSQDWVCSEDVTTASAFNVLPEWCHHTILP